MCKIKTGVDIKSKSDISNLLTALILRQKDYFTKEHIATLSRYYMKDSPCQIDDWDLNEMIDDHIDVFCRNDELVNDYGRYLGATV